MVVGSQEDICVPDDKTKTNIRIFPKYNILMLISYSNKAFQLSEIQSCKNEFRKTKRKKKIWAIISRDVRP